MRSIILVSCLLLALTGVAVASGPNTHVPDQVVITLAFHDLKTGKQLYKGTRTQVNKDGVITVQSTYTDMNGQELDRSTTIYEAASLRVVSSNSEDIRFGKREQLALTGDKMKIVYVEGKGEKAETEVITWGAESATTSTVAEMMIKNWAPLAAGKAVELDLVVPSRTETIRFRFKKDRNETLDGQAMMVVRMEPNSWLIRKLVDPMFFFFSESMPHKLIEYHGRASIKTADNKDQDLRMVFAYQ